MFNTGLVLRLGDLSFVGPEPEALIVAFEIPCYVHRRTSHNINVSACTDLLFMNFITLQLDITVLSCHESAMLAVDYYSKTVLRLLKDVSYVPIVTELVFPVHKCFGNSFPSLPGVW